MTITPNSGSGDGTINVVASENTGANERSSSIIVSGGGMKRTIGVNQEAVAGGIPGDIYLQWPNNTSNYTDRTTFKVSPQGEKTIGIYVRNNLDMIIGQETEKAYRISNKRLAFEIKFPGGCAGASGKYTVFLPKKFLVPTELASTNYSGGFAWFVSTDKYCYGSYAQNGGSSTDPDNWWGSTNTNDGNALYGGDGVLSYYGDGYNDQVTIDGEEYQAAYLYFYPDDDSTHAFIMFYFECNEEMEALSKIGQPLNILIGQQKNGSDATTLFDNNVFFIQTTYHYGSEYYINGAFVAYPQIPKGWDRDNDLATLYLNFKVKDELIFTDVAYNNHYDYTFKATTSINDGMKDGDASRNTFLTGADLFFNNCDFIEKIEFAYFILPPYKSMKIRTLSSKQDSYDEEQYYLVEENAENLVVTGKGWHTLDITDKYNMKFETIMDFNELDGFHVGVRYELNGLPIPMFINICDLAANLYGSEIHNYPYAGDFGNSWPACWVRNLNYISEDNLFYNDMPSPAIGVSTNPIKIGTGNNGWSDGPGYDITLEAPLTIPGSPDYEGDLSKLYWFIDFNINLMYQWNELGDFSNNMFSNVLYQIPLDENQNYYLRVIIIRNNATPGQYGGIYRVVCLIENSLTTTPILEKNVANLPANAIGAGDYISLRLWLNICVDFEKSAIILNSSFMHNSQYNTSGVWSGNTMSVDATVECKWGDSGDDSIPFTLYSQPFYNQNYFYNTLPQFEQGVPHKPEVYLNGFAVLFEPKEK